MMAASNASPTVYPVRAPAKSGGHVARLANASQGLQDSETDTMPSQQRTTSASTAYFTSLRPLSAPSGTLT